MKVREMETTRRSGEIEVKTKQITTITIILSTIYRNNKFIFSVLIRVFDWIITVNPIIINKRLAAIRGLRPASSSGTINHESSGPQYPFIALL